jgi:hypothetical protein
MLDTILAIIISKISDALWNALFLEARILRSRIDISMRINQFRGYLSELENNKSLTEDEKNEALDRSARILLYGRTRMREPYSP